MITLIANDDKHATLSESAAKWSPYIMDAFWGNELESPHEKTLDVPFATSEQLYLLKQVLEAKDKDGGTTDFIPSRGTLRIGELPVPAPPFVVIKWMPALDRVMSALREHEIIALLHVANDMCIWELRAGVICLMLHKIIIGQYNFEEFFATQAPSKLSEIIYKIYNEFR